MTAFILLAIGGLNWGLIGINPDWNILNLILGSIPTLERLVYVLIGASALYLLVTHKGSCKTCMEGKHKEEG